jgi:hypothetical protein
MSPSCISSERGSERRRLTTARACSSPIEEAAMNIKGVGEGNVDKTVLARFGVDTFDA